MKREEEIDEKETLNHYLFEKLAFMPMLLSNYYCIYLCMCVHNVCGCVDEFLFFKSAGNTDAHLHI